jgi:hypothetical protein
VSEHDREVASHTDRWTAAHCRCGRALFSICGVAGVGAAREGPADLALALTSLSGQFAWHAELLFDLLPTQGGVDPERLVAAPAPGMDAALSLLEALVRSEAWPTLCVVLARVVVPRLRCGVGAALERTDARLDGPRVRALTLLARDLADALELLEPLAERALAPAGAVASSSARCAEVERALVDAGVRVGLVASAGNAREG